MWFVAVIEVVDQIVESGHQTIHPVVLFIIQTYLIIILHAFYLLLYPIVGKSVVSHTSQFTFQTGNGVLTVVGPERITPAAIHWHRMVFARIVYLVVILGIIEELEQRVLRHMGKYHLFWGHHKELVIESGHILLIIEHIAAPPCRVKYIGFAIDDASAPLMPVIPYIVECNDIT